MAINWRQVAALDNPEALFIGKPGETRYDSAIIGIGRRCGQPSLIVYSYEKLVEAFMREDKLTHDEATEYIDFNIAGAWLGEHTPVLVSTHGAEAEFDETVVDSVIPADC